MTLVLHYGSPFAHAILGLASRRQNYNLKEIVRDFGIAYQLL